MILEMLLKVNSVNQQNLILNQKLIMKYEKKNDGLIQKNDQKSLEQDFGF
jgi:hypothetical protein